MQEPAMPVMNVAKFERFFRLAASVDVDKEDLRRYNDFVDHKVYDLLLRGEAIAKQNGHVAIEPSDLPITKGLQENMHVFREIDREVQVEPVLDAITKHPIDFTYTEETEAELGRIAGGLSVALARSFKVMDPDLKNPQPEDWERAFRLFDLTL
jgi:hypothetical protein